MTNNPSSSQFVRIRKAAEILGVSVDTVRRWDKSGRIKSTRSDGGHRLFSTEHLENFNKNRPLLISEAAHQLNIPAHVLRRYEQDGLIKPERSAIGERLYTADVLEQCRRVGNGLDPVEKVELVDPVPGIEPSVAQSVQLLPEPSHEKKIIKKPGSLFRVIWTQSLAISALILVLLATGWSSYWALLNQQRGQDGQRLGMLQRSIEEANRRPNVDGQVLAVSSDELDKFFLINVPTIFTDLVTLEANVEGLGQSINLGSGTITASNLVYSLQGQKGDIELAAGEGIGIDGLTISSLFEETSQDLFSDIKVGTDTIVADTAADALEFVAGTNVAITIDAAQDQLTFSATDTSGLTTFKLAGDGGSSQTIADGNTLTIVGGTGVTTSAGSTDKLTIDVTATLQNVYDNDVDSSDAIIVLTSADDSVEIDNPASGGSDSGFAFQIDQNATGVIAFNIDAENTTADVVNISVDQLTTAIALDIPDLDALTTGTGLNIVSNSSNTTGRNLVSIVNDNTAATGAVPLYIRQDSTGDIVQIFDGTSQVVTIFDEGQVGVGVTTVDGTLNVTSTTAADEVLVIVGAASQTENLIEARDSDGNLQFLMDPTGAVVFNDEGNDADFRVEGDNNTSLLHADASSDRVGIGQATPGAKLEVEIGASDAATGLLIDANDADQIAFQIDGEQTTADIIDLSADVLTTGIAIDIPDLDSLTTGSGLNIVSNSADTSSRDLVGIVNENTLATGTTLLDLRQDAAAPAVLIDQNGNGIALTVDSEAAGSLVGDIDGSGDNDIFEITASHTSFTNDILVLNANEETSGGFNFIKATADIDGVSSDVFVVDEDGDLTIHAIAYTWPSADGSSDYILTTNGSGTLAWQDVTGVGGAGDITTVGDCISGACFAGTSGTTLTFNDTDGDGTLAMADLSTARTWTLPNATGTISVIGQTIETGEITDDTILEVDLDLTNSPTDDYILSYDSGSAGFTWITNDGGSGASKWSDGGDITYLTSATDDLALGGSTSSSPFFFDEGEEQLNLNNSTTNQALLINQDGNGIAFDIDSEATSADIINIQATVLTTGRAIDIPDLDALTTGTGVNIVSNSSNTSERYLVNIHNVNTLATGAQGLLINQDADGLAFSIDSEAATADVIDIASPATTTGNVIDINADALTTGQILELTSDSADTGTRALVQITNDNTSATGATPLQIQQDAAARALFIDQNGNGVSLAIDSEASGSLVGDIDGSGDNDIFEITASNAIFSNDILVLNSNEEDDDSFFFLHLISDIDGTPDTELTIDQAGNIVTDGTITSSGLDTNLTEGSVVFANSAGALAQDNANFFWDDTANELGIGTTAPAANLEIQIGSTDGATGFLINADDADQIAFQIDGEQTTADIIDILATVLTTGIGIDLNSLDALTTGTGIAVTSNSTDTSARDLVTITNDNTSATGAVLLRLNQDSTGDIFQAWDGTSQVVTIDDEGNVGIGTTSPTSLLHIDKLQNAGTWEYITNNSTGTAALAGLAIGEAISSFNYGTLHHPGQSFTTSGLETANRTILTGYDTAGLAIGANNSSAPLIFFTGALSSTDSERMRIDSSGNVGIGTTSIGALLEVEIGSADAVTGFLIDADDADQIAFQIDGEQTTADIIDILGTVLTTGRAIDLADLDALTTGTGINVVSNSGDDTERYLVNIDNRNSSAPGTRGLRIKQESAQDALFIDQNGNGNAIQIENAGTAAAIFINQDGEGLSIDIDSEATTADILNIQATTLTTGIAIDIPDLNALTTGTGINVVSDSSDTSIRHLVNIHNINTAADAAIPLRIRQDADTDLIQLWDGTTEVFTVEDGGNTNIYANTLSGTTAIINFEDFDVSADGLIVVANDADGAGLTIAPSAATTTAVDLSDTDISNAIDIDANFVLFDGIRVFEGTTGTLTFEDTSGNDLATLTDNSNLGDFVLSGDLAVNGDDITADGDLTLNPAGGDLFLADGDTLVIGGLTGVAYNAMSDSGTTSNSLASDDDLYIEGDLEVDGTIYADGGSIDLAFTEGSIVFINSSGALAQDNSNFFWDDSANELGIGTTAPAANLEIQIGSTDGATGVLINADDADQIAFQIDGEQTTADIIDILATVLTTGIGIDLADLDALTTGTGINVVSNSGDDTERYLVNIDNRNSSAPGTRGLRIKQESAQSAFFIDQNGEGLSIDIDSEATTADIINIAGTTLTTGRAIDIADLNALTTGTGLNIVSDSSDTSERYLVNIHQDHADAAAAVGLRIRQDGGGDIMRLYQGATSVFTITSAGDVGINTTAPAARLEVEITDGENIEAVIIDQNETGAVAALQIDNQSTGQGIMVNQNGNGRGVWVSTSATSQHGLEVIGTVLTTGDGMRVVVDNTMTSGRAIRVRGGASGVSEVFSVDEDGNTGIGTTSPVAKLDIAVGSSENRDGIFIDQDDAGQIGLSIDSEATTVDVVNIAATVLTTGIAIDIPDLDALTTGTGIAVTSNSSNTSARDLVTITNDHVDATGAVLLRLNQDSTGDIFQAWDGTSQVVTIDDVGQLAIGSGVAGGTLDGILHLDNGTSNTDLIIEKDAGTAAKIIFHNAGAQGANVTFSSGENLVVENDTQDLDIIFQVNDGGVVTTVMTVDGDVSRVGIGDNSPGAKLEIQSDASATVLLIDQNDDNIGISIISDATTAAALSITGGAQTTGDTVVIASNALTTGQAFQVTSNSTDATARNMVFFENINTSATAATVLEIEQEADANALRIDQNGNGQSIIIATDQTTANVIQITADSVTSGVGLSTSLDALTTGSIMNLISNSADTSTRRLVTIQNDHVDATGALLLRLIQDSTGDMVRMVDGASQVVTFDDEGHLGIGAGATTPGAKLEVDVGSSDALTGVLIDANDADQIAFQIDGEQTTADIIDILGTVLTTGRAIDLADLDALTTGTGINVVSNSGDDTERYLVNIDNRNSSAPGTRGLRIKQESAQDALFIDQNGNGNAIQIENAGTAAAIFIDQNGEGLSIDIDSEATTADIINIAGTTLTTGIAIDIADLNALTTGTGLNIVSNSSNTSERYLVNIDQDHADAAGAVVLRLKQDSTADIVQILDGSSEVFTILDGGNVGIGEVAPGATLEIVSTGSLRIPQGTGPTVDAAGELAIDTTSDQLVFYGGAKRVVTYKRNKTVTLESPADADNFNLFKAPYAITITDIECIVDPADSSESAVIDVQERDATADNPATVDATITCDNDGAADDGSLTNGTIDSGDWVSLDIGTVTGTVTQVTVTISYTVDSD